MWYIIEPTESNASNIHSHLIICLSMGHLSHCDSTYYLIKVAKYDNPELY